MKRLICLFLAVAMVFSMLLVGARAAEEYVFEWVNPDVVFFEDYDFIDSGAAFYYCSQTISNGLYYLDFWVFIEGFVLQCSSEISLMFSVDDSNDLSAAVSVPCVLSSDSASEEFLLDFEFIVFGDGVVCLVSDSGTELGGFDSYSFTLSSILAPAGISPIFEAIPFLDVILASLFSVFSSNPLFASFCAAGLVTVAVPLYQHLKKHSR